MSISFIKLPIIKKKLTVHKLEQFVDYGAQELPMRLEEAGVLTHHVHYVRGHNGLVVFTSLLFAQAQ